MVADLSPKQAAPIEHVSLEKGEAVLLDALGALPVLTAPSGEDALLLDLEGRINKTRQRWVGRFLMRPEQGAELVAAIAVAVRRFGSEDFRREFATALQREQERLDEES